MFRVRVPKLQTEENVSFGLFLVHVPRLASMGVVDIWVFWTGWRVWVFWINGQNHGFARAIEISRFFLDLIIVDASEMNNTVGIIFISASKRFLFKLVCF